MDSENEDRIRQALAAWETRDSPPTFRNLALAQSVLCDQARGKRQNRWQADEHEQKLPPGTERALEKWCQDMDDCGFPPPMDIKRGMAMSLAKRTADEENNSELAIIGRHWTNCFLNRHPALAAQ